MATTRIMPTHVSKRQSKKDTIKRGIDYILDKNKTKTSQDAPHDAVGADVDVSVADATDAEHKQHETRQTSTHETSTNQTSNPAMSSIHDYIQDPGKTVDYELVKGYECTPSCAHEEFAQTMDEYENNTGRKQKDNSRLYYHVRQSFKPGEITPELANKIGYELAMEFFKGEHAFVVATHTDKAHIHNHIIANAFNLDCSRKFKDPWLSGKLHVPKISDRLCSEYGLSVIEHKQGWADPYNIWEEKQGITKQDRVPTNKRKLENIITTCLEKKPKDFKQLLKFMEDYSCYAKKRGKDISIKTPFSEKPIRLSSLRWDLRQEEIEIQIQEQNNHNYNNINIASASNVEQDVVNQNNQEDKLKLLIDIKNSLKATESIGYKRWAENFNLEQMSQTLLFIEKHKLTLDGLRTMASNKNNTITDNTATENQNIKNITTTNNKSKTLSNIISNISAVDDKLQHIATLQRHIGTYGKTKNIYREYKQLNSKQKHNVKQEQKQHKHEEQKHETQKQFWQEHSKTIIAHEDTKAYFNESGYSFGSGNKLPNINALQQEYAKLEAEKKSLWSEYHKTKNNDGGIHNTNTQYGNAQTINTMGEINTKDAEIAWANVKAILNIQDDDMSSAVEQPATEQNKKDKKNIKQNETRNIQNNIQNSIQTKNNDVQNKKDAPKKHKRGAMDL